MSKQLQEPVTTTPRQLLARVLRPFDVGHDLLRIGDFGDGGYLVPDDLSGIGACFSPGVAKRSSFELDLAKRGIPSFMADASVDGPIEPVPGASFRKQNLGAHTDRSVISLNDWIEECAPAEGDLLLQIDIEGAEYGVFSTASPKCLTRFRIIVMELHRIPSILLKPEFFQKTKPLFEKFAEAFTCTHIHPNNVSGQVEIEGTLFPRVVEATFIRNDRVAKRSPVTKLPHPLDARHDAKRPGLAIPDEWLC